MSLKEIDDNMTAMLGELEPNVPNVRKKNARDAVISPITGERIPKAEAR